MVRIEPTVDEMVRLTERWSGERLPDGRPLVPDDVLDELARATTEHAWQVLTEQGYDRQFAGGWQRTRPDQILVGRALTAQFLPHRPDLDAVVVAAGAREGHTAADRQNSWVVDRLQRRDVMVADIFGKVAEGTVIGDNLGAAVVARTGAGAVIDGGIRDLQGLSHASSGTIFFRDVDPTPIRHVTLAGIDLPVRIGAATVLPGDVVLGTPTGVIFIPPHLAERVVDVSVDVRARDEFAKVRLATGTYAADEIDVPAWPTHIEADFLAWRAAAS